VKKKTYIVDLDGCVLQHYGRGPSYQWKTCVLLDGVKEQFDRWEMDGHCVVLMTARKECCRADLEETLRAHGLFWDRLVMGVTSGERVLINDSKPGYEPSARAVTLERNRGLACLEGKI